MTRSRHRTAVTAGALSAVLALAGYGVGHANTILAYSADDRLPVVYPGGVRPSDVAADLPDLAAGTTTTTKDP